MLIRSSMPLIFIYRTQLKNKTRKRQRERERIEDIGETIVSTTMHFYDVEREGRWFKGGKWTIYLRRDTPFRLEASKRYFPWEQRKGEKDRKVTEKEEREERGEGLKSFYEGSFKTILRERRRISK